MSPYRVKGHLCIMYKTVNPIQQFDFQINRVLTYGEKACDEDQVISALANVKNIDEWYEAWLSLANDAINANEHMHAAYYYRMAEFFLKHDDSRKEDVFRKCLNEFNLGFAQNDISFERFAIPYENGYMKCFRMEADNSKETILVCGGYDSFIEEFVLQVNDFVKRGFSIILFEGPGQGECIDQGIYFTDAFHKAASKVIDFFDLKTCAFVGISWGGYFALESAANEARINKVVAYDVLDNGLEVMTNVYPSPIKQIIRTLIKGKHEKAINFLCSRIGKKSVIADWMLAQGMYITGSSTPYEMYQKLGKHNLNGQYQNIRQDVLLLAGEKDHYVPRVQFERCRSSIHNAHTLTTRLFTESEGGHQHCQIGNHTIATTYIMSWIDSNIRTDSRQ